MVRSSFGHTAVDIVTWGAILAIFNASLAITLQFARVTYASGRDMAWPAPISRALSYVNPRFKMPWVATMFVGVTGAILCAQSSLISVVTFTAVLIIILYALIAISALVSRVRQKDLERPYRMPLWPVSSGDRARRCGSRDQPAEEPRPAHLRRHLRRRARSTTSGS